MRASTVTLALALAAALALPRPGEGSLKRFINNGPTSAPVSPVLPLNVVSDFTDWVDLSTLGGPAVAISSALYQALQKDIIAVFKLLAGPGLPLGMFTTILTDKWTSELVAFQYAPGLQGFLSLFMPGEGMLQDKLVKAVCTIYPWTPAVPPPVQVLKAQYCVKAIPAEILSKITQGLPLPSALPLPPGK